MSNSKGKVGWVLAALVVVGVAVYFGRQSVAPTDEVEEETVREEVDKKAHTTTASKEEKEAIDLLNRARDALSLARAKLQEADVKKNRMA